jgi:hypothetical protein
MNVYATHLLHAMKEMVGHQSAYKNKVNEMVTSDLVSPKDINQIKHTMSR